MPQNEILYQLLRLVTGGLSLAELILTNSCDWSIASLTSLSSGYPTDGFGDNFLIR